MAETFTVSNTWMTYISNGPYVYPTDEKATIPSAKINTGWHIIPNLLWRHFVTPKQWAELMINYESYHVDSITVSIFNMIPMTHQIAIQGNTVFTAFNNCIYALAYEDKLYETSWENWLAPAIGDIGHNLLYKEGLTCTYNMTDKKRYELPVYQWSPPNSRPRSARTYENIWEGEQNWSAVYPAGNRGPGSTNNYGDRPSGVLWDPLNRPDHLLELRPGKNAIKLSWNCHPCDNDKWFNLDQLVWWWPWTPDGPYNFSHPRPNEYQLTSECDPDRLASQHESDPYVNDYTIPNLSDLPIVPMSWWWKEFQNSIVPYTVKGDTVFRNRANHLFPGTESEMYKYGPHQMFTKLIPLFDDKGTHIAATANVSVQTTITLSVKKRRSALYAPTWGPFSWYDLYCARGFHRRFTPALIRYRTGGMRRTWQNFGDTITDQMEHPRETPYNYQATNQAGQGVGNTRSAFPVVKYSTASDSATIVTHSRRAPVPSAPPLEEMDHEPLYPPIDQLKRRFV